MCSNGAATAEAKNQKLPLTISPKSLFSNQHSSARFLEQAFSGMGFQFAPGERRDFIRRLFLVFFFENI